MTPTVIALGFFDGIHKGHQAVFQKTIERANELGATPTVFTFDRPPKEVVTGKTVLLINSAEERKELIYRLFGIDNVIFATFDEEMMHMPWERFIEDLLVKEYGAVHLVAGHDYRFGSKNEGNVELLQQKCKELGIGCDIVPEVDYKGRLVSSTYIRTLVEAGNVEEAAEYLGHPHCLTQTVEHGFRIGRTIGIPTINLQIPYHVLLPKQGVYISEVFLPDGRHMPGVTNVGTRPTVSDSDRVSVETFLVDFEGDLYGQRIRLDFCKPLREETKFNSLEELKEQIEKDIAKAREYFAAK